MNANAQSADGVPIPNGIEAELGESRVDKFTRDSFYFVWPLDYFLKNW
ncbi:MAG: hypothetical protein WAV16_02975 [Candidatus Moraniibacteriota bacterium]